MIFKREMGLKTTSHAFGNGLSHEYEQKKIAICGIDFSSESGLSRKKSARICKKSIDPICASYMVVLPPETGGRWCRLKLQFGSDAGFE